MSMDSFPCMLDNEVNLCLYNPISYKNCKLSYLIFVDDLVVTGVINETTTYSFKHSLDMLAIYMGLENYSFMKQFFLQILE